MNTTTPIHPTLNKRHAVITGASKGIGAAIARALAHAGINLTLIGRNQEKLDELAQTLQTLTSTFVCAVDITQASKVQASLELAVNKLGPIDILVNNAGQATSQSFAKTDLQLWNQMMDNNLTGTYICTHAAMPHMLKAVENGATGRIINIASTAGLQGYSYVAAYTAAKHGVIGLTRALALELARKKITVNAICPGFTETDILADAIENIMKQTGKSEAEARLALASRNPQQRLIQTEEIAHTVLWLCSPSSDSINGQTIAIDGGELAG